MTSPNRYTTSPSFRVRLTSDNNAPTTNAWFSLGGFNTIDWNDFGSYIPGLAGFRAPRAGRYLFYGACALAIPAGTIGSLAFARYDKTATTLIERGSVNQTYNALGAAAAFVLGGTSSFFLELDEYVAFQVYLGSGAGGKIFGVTGTESPTVFAGHALT